MCDAGERARASADAESEGDSQAPTAREHRMTRSQTQLLAGLGGGAAPADDSPDEELPGGGDLYHGTMLGEDT